MVYLHGGERVFIEDEEWTGIATVQSVDEPKSTEVENGEYITVRVESGGIRSGTVEPGLVTTKASNVEEVKE